MTRCSAAPATTSFMAASAPTRSTSQPAGVRTPSRTGPREPTAIIDLTGLAGLGVHAITDLTQTITGGNDVITSSHTGTNSITLLGVGSALTASSFHFA